TALVGAAILLFRRTWFCLPKASSPAPAGLFLYLRGARPRRDRHAIILCRAMNKYLSYDEERAPKVRAMFSRLAWGSDLVNDAISFGLHRGWKRQTVALAADGLAPGGRWL